MSSSILFCLVKGPGIRLFSAPWPGFVLTLTFHFTIVTLYNNLTFSLCIVTWDIIIYITVTMSDLTFDSNLMFGLCTLNWLYAVTWYMTSFNNKKRGVGVGGWCCCMASWQCQWEDQRRVLGPSGWWSSFCRKSLEIKSCFHFSNLSFTCTDIFWCWRNYRQWKLCFKMQISLTDSTVQYFGACIRIFLTAAIRLRIQETFKTMIAKHHSKIGNVWNR